MTLIDAASPTTQVDQPRKAEKPQPFFPTSVDEFSELVDGLQGDESYQAPQAFAIGIATIYEDLDSEIFELLDVDFPTVNGDGENGGSAALLYAYSDPYGEERESRLIGLGELKNEVLPRFAPFKGDGKVHANIDAIKTVIKVLKTSKGKLGHGRSLVPVVAWISDLQAPPKDAIDARLRLALLSHLKVQPDSINAEVFGPLPIVAWTSEGPLHPSQVADVRYKLMAKGRQLHVYGVDKFPSLLDYVIPSGVRVADGTRVRIGAHLAESTTVMHEGFVNFNAGTLGKSMVEGRISAGVTVGDGSDIGGGASIMGTLSGGGTEKITVGKGSLLGANSGIGISLGDNCVVEAGLYVTAGNKVTLADKRLINDFEADVIKASQLSGRDNLLFRRNSQHGDIEVLIKDDGAVTLNEALHANAGTPA